MKYLFLFLLALLSLASVVTYQMTPEARSDVPVLYWVTDPNPARKLQVSTFQSWLKKNNYPAYALEVDTANMTSDKVLIQAVSGVCADIIGHTGGSNMRLRQAVGILDDVTDRAQELGFGTDKTYAAMEPELTVDGRQYAFPCNVYAHLLWINEESFAKYGLPLPTKRWTFAEFEAMGKRFVDAANEPGKPRMHFFLDGLDTTQMIRSLGLSRFNETMTACTLDDPRMIEVLKLVYKWTYEDHILPSKADRDSFATDAGYGGSTMQLFNSGNYAMFRCGRYGLIQLREFSLERRKDNRPALQLEVSEPPHGGFPNTSTGTRAAAVYKGGKHRQLAEYFLAYLASEDYNMNIVRDADALPPNPAVTKTEAYLRPLPLLPELVEFFPYSEQEEATLQAFSQTFYAVTDTYSRDSELDAKHFPAPPKPAGMSDGKYAEALAKFRVRYNLLIENYQAEWGCHEAFSEALADIAIPGSSSPFVLNAVAQRKVGDAVEGYMSHKIDTPEEVTKIMAETVNEEIQRTLEEDPRKAMAHARLSDVQKKIDRRRADGEKVPLDWITNPFHRAYYQAKGWAE
ncbi:MAG: extracellular solute-binding protein [Victivallales bacterium]|nr:extracellular solute-binding protein [Victivallales bacterium]